MTSRGRGGSISDWDPMREDFNDSHNHYDDASEAVSLDYTKLYVANLPAALGPEGLAELFSKYGKVLNSYFSRDPVKRYAFVSFETAGEARIAMMKLNKTEPFGLHINFAHGKPNDEEILANTLADSGIEADEEEELTTEQLRELLEEHVDELDDDIEDGGDGGF